MRGRQLMFSITSGRVPRAINFKPVVFVGVSFQNDFQAPSFLAPTLDGDLGYEIDFPLRGVNAYCVVHQAITPGRV